MSRAIDSSIDLSDLSGLSLETVVSGIPDAVIVARAGSGEIVAANEAAGSLFEGDPNRLVGRDQQELHPSADAELYREAFARGLDDERVTRLADGRQVYVDTLEGNRTPVEINAQRIEADGRAFLLGVFRDITDRRARERRLERTETRLSALIDTTPVPVAALDDQLRVTLWNRAAEETLGYADSDVLGETYTLFVDQRQFEAAAARVLEGKRLDGYETVLRAKDGSRVEVALSARPLVEDGAITGLVGAAVDVTSENRRRQHLEVAHRVLRHNLRSKLSVIRGYASLLREDEAVPREEVTERIVEASDKLAELSDHASVVRREIQRSAAGTVTVAELLRTAAETDAGGTEAGETALSVETATRPATVSEQAAPALSRLLDRMRSYTDADTIRVEARVEDRYVEIALAGEQALLSRGDAELIAHEEESVLRHGHELAIARGYLTIASFGGDVIQVDGADSRRQFRAELPRVDGPAAEE